MRPPRPGRLAIPVLRLPHAAGLPLPASATVGSAGIDLLAAVAAPLDLAPLERRLVPTGLRLALPPGYEGQVRPRSGLAFEHGVTVLNSPGTIDADYRGEIGVLLVNLGAVPYTIRRGARIAQLVVGPVTAVQLVEAEGGDLDATARGAGGFGSTGGM